MNYDEKAGKICAELRSIRLRLEGGYDEDRSPISLIAAALRESAARVYQDEAAPGWLSEEEKTIMAWNGFHGTNDTNRLKALVRRLLTPAPNREAEFKDLKEACPSCGFPSDEAERSLDSWDTRRAKDKVIEAAIGLEYQARDVSVCPIPPGCGNVQCEFHKARRVLVLALNDLASLAQAEMKGEGKK